MKRLILIATATTLLTACGDKGAEQNVPAIENEVTATAAAAPGSDAVLGPAIAADKAKALMHERHEGMEAIGDAFKLVNRELKGDNPDMAAIRKAADEIAAGAAKAPGWFPPGTGPDIGKTRAKAEIWQKPQDFAAKDAGFLPAAQAFKAAADAGEINAIKAKAGELGKACKACHDPYRAEEGHGG
jgi:cytochrome c556